MNTAPAGSSSGELHRSSFVLTSAVLVLEPRYEHECTTILTMNYEIGRIHERQGSQDIFEDAQSWQKGK